MFRISDGLVFFWPTLARRPLAMRRRRPAGGRDGETSSLAIRLEVAVELARAPTLLEKSRLFPSATFVIGADTAERLVAAKYYGDDELQIHVALEEIAYSSFLVTVRIDAVGRVRALNGIPVPRRYVDLFSEIPELRFRFDISSSEIRARRLGRETHSW